MNTYRFLGVAALLAAIAAWPVSAADTSALLLVPPDPWVLPPPPPTGTANPGDAALRIGYVDTQTRLTSAGTANFSAYRLKILKPEALSVGNIILRWSPAAGAAKVHWLRVIRGGKPIDVLATSAFRVIQREENLEQAVLSGLLTATLQVPGLTVGDEIEFAATVESRDPTIGDKAFGALQLPIISTPGSYRVRLLWPQSSPLHWQASKDMTGVVPSLKAGEQQLLVKLDEPATALLTEGAPARYNVRRRIEFTEFAGWEDVSRRFESLFAKAASIPADSPLRAEAARIAAASSDPRTRLTAALRLVQDQIRYVYIGFEGGNFLPTTADAAWRQRFGDCKAKTAVLLALLDQLGIKAEAVLVDITGGDVTGEQLASPAAFNHVLVRATIGGTSYWIDGTRQGDRNLDALRPPLFRWALPLRPDGAALEAVPAVAPRWPDVIDVADIDASAGIDKPAKVRKTRVLRGDDTAALRVQLAALPKPDADRELSALWRRESAKLEVDKVGWRSDDASGALILWVEGREAQDWSGDGDNDHSLDIVGAGFSPPAERRRPADQDQAAPWLNDFPRYRCWATTIRLPPASRGSIWAYRSAPVDRQIDGDAYWRRAGLTGGVMRTVMSRRAVTPEITADEARATNAQLANFDRAISRVFEAADGPARTGQSKAAPFADDTDWAAADAPCAAPAGSSVPSLQPTEPVRSPRNMVRSSDYPLESRRRAEAGVVRTRIEIAASGWPTTCRVQESSGYPALDKASCAIVMNRFYWQPARNRTGAPTPGVAVQPIRWQPSDDSPRALLFGVTLRNDRPSGDSHRCSFSDGVTLVVAKADPCVRPLPTSDGARTILDAQQAAILAGSTVARFDRGMLLLDLSYLQGEADLRAAAAAGFAPATARLCAELGARAATPAATDEAIGLCLGAIAQGAPDALESAPDLIFASRHRLGAAATAAALDKIAIVPSVILLLAQVWHEAGDPAKALPLAYVAARSRSADAWGLLSQIFSAPGTPWHDAKAGYVWGRVAGVPVDRVAAELSTTDRADADRVAAACEADVKTCTAGETPALKAAMAAARRRFASRLPERLDTTADHLAIPDSAGIWLAYRVDLAGRVDDCGVGGSSRDYRRDRAACDWLIEHAQFTPGVIGGVPAAVWRSAPASAETP